MEFPEPYQPLPIREWRTYKRAHPNSYPTTCVRRWLRGRYECRLGCHERGEQPGGACRTQLNLDPVEFRISGIWSAWFGSKLRSFRQYSLYHSGNTLSAYFRAKTHRLITLSDAALTSAKAVVNEYENT